MGGFQGDLSAARAPDLGATAIKAALDRAVVAPDDVAEAYMGIVLPAGLGQAPARALLSAWRPLASTRASA